MTWSKETIEQYHSFAKTYVSTYTHKIDCADLALAMLADFAAQNKLIVKLKSWSSGNWEWFGYNPDKDDAAKYKKRIMSMLGAVNVIDNTKAIPIASAKPGDVIMSQWSGSSGHTRIIYELTFDPKTSDYDVIWYQGNLPVVIPQKKTGTFSSINGVFGGSPRRWKFEQFE